MSLSVLAFLFGIVAGLRTLTPPAAIAWAAWLGWLDLDETWLAFLGYPWTAPILTIMAIGELVGDKLSRTPSRKRPLVFAARIVSGALCGAVLTAPSGASHLGLMAGILGAVIGTRGGYALRTRFAAAAGRDWPVALVEDAVAVAGAALAVWSLHPV